MTEEHTTSSFAEMESLCVLLRKEILDTYKNRNEPDNIVLAAAFAATIAELFLSGIDGAIKAGLSTEPYKQVVLHATQLLKNEQEPNKNA
jgi:hypothetical protein